MLVKRIKSRRKRNEKRRRKQMHLKIAKGMDDMGAIYYRK
jgi:hypothetical protein